MKNRIVWAEDIIWREIGNEIAVIEDDGVSVHMLNKTASQIWKMCNGDYEIDEISASLCEQFDVSPEEAHTDTLDTIKELARIGLINQSKETIIQ